MIRIAPYRAPWWLPGGNAQTLYAALFADAGAIPDYRRTRWDTPDGDFVDIDWMDADADSPLVVLFHGLEGGSSQRGATRSWARMSRPLCATAQLTSGWS